MTATTSGKGYGAGGDAVGWRAPSGRWREGQLLAEGSSGVIEAKSPEMPPLHAPPPERHRWPWPQRWRWGQVERADLRSTPASRTTSMPGRGGVSASDDGDPPCRSDADQRWWFHHCWRGAGRRLPRPQHPGRHEGIGGLEEQAINPIEEKVRNCARRCRFAHIGDHQLGLADGTALEQRKSGFHFDAAQPPGGGGNRLASS